VARAGERPGFHAACSCPSFKTELKITAGVLDSKMHFISFIKMSSVENQHPFAREVKNAFQSAIINGGRKKISSVTNAGSTGKALPEFVPNLSQAGN
jgi:hypothetical protein